MVEFHGASVTTYSMTGPDGKTYSIDGPPGATQEQVVAQLSAAHGNLAKSPETPSSVVDAIRSIPGGLAKGITGLAGLPGDMQNLFNAGIDKLTGANVANAKDIGGIPLVKSPTSGALNDVVSKPFGGYYEPQTLAGKLTERTAEFAPAALGGEASIPSKLMGRMLAPAAGSMAGGSLVDEKAHPYLHAALETGGALLGGGLASGARALGGALKDVNAPAEDVANKYVSQLLTKSGGSPDTVIANAVPGRGQMAAEAMGAPGIGALATLGRRPGSTGEALGAALSERSQSAPTRILADVAQASGIDPGAAVGNMENIVKQGRAAASPLYTKAFAGGSVAPLEDQFRSALTAATGAKGQIAKQISTIEQSNPGALAARGAAGADVRAKYMDLHGQLNAAEADRKATLDMFKRAQADKSSNAPGAVWSPRVQQFLDDPIVKQGINKGLEIQRLESLASGKPFHPSEIGVTGTSETGEPIIESVPNMRLLDAGKRGLDSILESYRNPITRSLDLDERGRAIEAVRKSYLDELDSLNPDYKAARSAAGDYLSANSAFKTGGDHLLNPGTTAKQVQDYFGRLNPSNQQAYQAGIANKLFNQAQNGRLRPAHLLTPAVQQKVTAAFGPDKAQNFITGLQQELALAKSGARMMPGANSITSDVLLNAGDQDASAGIRAGMHGMHAAGNLLQGNVLGAVGGGLTALKHFAPDLLKTGGMSAEARDQAGRLLMLPPDELAGHLRGMTTMPTKKSTILGQFLGSK